MSIQSPSFAQTSQAAESARPHVGLFVTCLVDLFRPSVGFAALKLLEDAGCAVSVPQSQTCCGQPAYNSGDRADTAAIAKATIGGGVEHKFTEAFSLKAELFYVDLEDTKIKVTDPVFPGNQIDYHFDNDLVIGRIGLNYAF